MDYKLECTKCDAEYACDSPRFECAECGSILEVSYDYSGMRLPKGFRKAGASNRKYLPFFPVSRMEAGMGEGGSELIPAHGLDGIVDGGVRLFLKVETENPTRTFKDRGSAVEISKAMELGFGEVCCASTGNMGLSLATYSRAHGIRCTVFISRDGNAEKIAKIRKAGARLVKVDGDFNDAMMQAESLARRRKGVFLCGDYHYRKEGQKSVAFEIVEQMKYGVPDVIFVQVGNATLLAAIYKGLREFMALGLIKRLPRLVAVQSEECAPLCSAYIARKAVKYMKPATAADAIAVGFPTFGFEAAAALKATRGSAVVVPDVEIEAAQQMLHSTMGIDAELGGAAGFAGFLKLYNEDRKRFRGKRVVVIVTGNNED